MLSEIKKLYDDFVDKMDKGLAAAPEAAACEVKIVRHYPALAQELRDAAKEYEAEVRRLAESIDEQTKKLTTGTKARQVADGSEVGQRLQEAKMAVDIYENYKYALKDYCTSMTSEWRDAQ